MPPNAIAELKKNCDFLGRATPCHRLASRLLRRIAQRFAQFSAAASVRFRAPTLADLDRAKRQCIAKVQIHFMIQAGSCYDRPNSLYDRRGRDMLEAWRQNPDLVLALKESRDPFIESFNTLPPGTEEESKLFALLIKEQKRTAAAAAPSACT